MRVRVKNTWTAYREHKGKDYGNPLSFVYREMFSYYGLLSAYDRMWTSSVIDSGHFLCGFWVISTSSRPFLFLCSSFTGLTTGHPIPALLHPLPNPHSLSALKEQFPTYAQPQQPSVSCRKGSKPSGTQCATYNQIDSLGSDGINLGFFLWLISMGHPKTKNKQKNKKQLFLLYN